MLPTILGTDIGKLFSNFTSKYSCISADIFYIPISFISFKINSFSFFLSGKCSIYVETNN